LRYDIITPPAVEPVTLEELKAQCRVFHDREDTNLEALGKAARKFCENETARCFIDQTIKVRLDYFEGHTINLPIGHAKSITSIQYRTTQASELVTYSGFQFSPGEPGRIRPSYAGWFPWTWGTLDGVEITYVCGFGESAVDVPDDLRAAILLTTAHWFWNREASTDLNLKEIPLGVQRILDNYKWCAGGVA
jgi:uncharacterized phiE125 gp8 family phage protein